MHASRKTAALVGAALAPVIAVSLPAGTASGNSRFFELDVNVGG
ncbi:hypothetical protein [Streptomyces sp. NPDC005805]